MLILGHFSLEPVGTGGLDRAALGSLIQKVLWSPPAPVLESDHQGGSKQPQVPEGVAPRKAWKHRRAAVSFFGMLSPPRRHASHTSHRSPLPQSHRVQGHSR